MVNELYRLPGQKVNISPALQQLLNQAQTECNRSIKFAVIQPNADFVGRIEWRDADILIEIRDTLDNPMAEYIAAHELCHALQLARGYPIASGRVDEPRAVAIATRITDFVCDSSADTMAVRFGFPMASSFEHWLKSTGLLGVLKKPKNGRRYGADWTKMWEKLETIRLCDQLDIKAPKPPKEFWTLWTALELANVIQRASNFSLTIGREIREDIARLSLLSRVVNDLLTISASGGICNIKESESKLVSIFGYIKTVPGHIFIYKPLTDQIYIDEHWQPRHKGEDLITRLLKRSHENYSR